jgi:hypothetical protein
MPESSDRRIGLGQGENDPDTYSVSENPHVKVTIISGANHTTGPKETDFLRCNERHFRDSDIESLPTFIDQELAVSSGLFIV